MTRVLVVATSRKTRGGITSVVKAHESGEHWKKYHCHWVQTHRDGANWRKILYFVLSVIDFTFRLPFYHIVHIHISQPVTVKRKKYFLKLANLFRKKIIVHFHAFDIESTIKGEYRGRYDSFFNKADLVIVLSEWWKKQIQDVYHLPSNRIEVVYNPCPSVAQDALKNDTNSILYAGTVNQRKGYSDLIYAFSHIASRFPSWKLVFAGNGELEQGKQLANSLGIAEQVEFLGWVSGIDKDNAFRRSSIFCLPSYAEGFPMAVLDAWAYGLPVVTTPVGGIPDVAVDGENMLLFNPGDITTLAKQLEKLIVNVSLRNHIAAASRDFALHRFNIQTINEQVGSIYKSLV